MQPDLRDAMKQLGLTRRGLADLFGVHRRTIQRWLDDPASIPRAVRIALVLMIEYAIDPASLVDSRQTAAA